MEVLQDADKIGLHVSLSPTWSETAWFADYILPMGLGTERHDTMSQETHAGQWLGFRQPVLRVAREKRGDPVSATHEANPGEVWEESEFWVALSWKIDPDGSLGLRTFFESPYRAGQPITMDEYYGWMFEHSVPGLPEAAAKESLTPLRTCGVPASSGLGEHLQPRAREGRLQDAVEESSSSIRRRSRSGAGPEHAIPRYVPGHVYWRDLKREEGEFDLLPNFRLPTLIHTRSAVKWLYEISHSNPLWISTADARQHGLRTGDLVRVRTRIGWFVTRVWVTEGIRPGVLGMSHHLGRWRLKDEIGGARNATALVTIARQGGGTYSMRQVHGAQAFASGDPDSQRIWWSEVGVHQNLTFPVQPDPVSGMHCWHQRVRLEKASPEDRYGDIEVDTEKAHEAYKEWMQRTRPAPGPDGTRRPMWFDRPLRPVASAYRMTPSR
jgi:anaerobic selenocysteine-containing dehydrogenase